MRNFELHPFTRGLQNAKDFNLRDFQWRLEGDKLYVLRNRFYLCLDLPTPTHQMLWEDTNLDFYISLPACSQDLIAFTACEIPSIQPTILGVFSRQTRQIVWLERTDILQQDKYASFDQAPPNGRYTFVFFGYKRHFAYF